MDNGLNYTEGHFITCANYKNEVFKRVVCGCMINLTDRIKAFLHKETSCNKSTRMTITESRTGLYIAKGNSEEEVVDA